VNIAQMVKQFMSRFTGILNLAEYGAVLDGATDCLAAINAMIGDIGARAVTLLVPGQCSVSANVTIPTNIRVRFEANGGFVGAGVVTYTQWGTSDPYLLVRTATAQVITNATYVGNTVKYDSVLRDSDAAYDPITGIFTVPNGKGGEYVINASISFGGAGGVTKALGLFKSGTQMVEAQDTNTPAAGTTIALNVTWTFVPGEQIELKAWQNSGAGQALSGIVVHNFLSIKRVG
jgi:hypothetical protein